MQSWISQKLVQELKRGVQLKRQTNTGLFYFYDALNNAKCSWPRWAWGFKENMKHKPFKQIKFQIKQAM